MSSTKKTTNAQPLADGSQPSSTPGITRRDFLHDLSVASLLAAMPGALLAENIRGGYPPTLTGMRGAHPGAFEVAHQLAREGKVFTDPQVLDEYYDLIVVGAGISGLSAAYFYRQKYGPDTRILLLDNHDDFGGHAKRNEFHQGGPMTLAWGGTVNIEYHKYSDVGVNLLAELGVDVPRLLEAFDFNWGDSATGLDVSCWFDRDTYGEDVLIRGLSFQSMDREALLQAIPRIPVSAAARAALDGFLRSDADVLPGMDQNERLAFTHRTRYEDFLSTYCGLPREAVALFSGATQGGWGVRAEDLSVAECLESGLPGAHRLGLAPLDSLDEAYPPSAMFPDGNASIARLLVRSLIPGAFPDMPAGADAFDIVTTKLDYAQLDVAGQGRRLRLNSTVVEARNEPDTGGVAVTYVRDGRIQQVRGAQCVLACYNRIIPHLCPELPPVQKEALAQCIKRPMLVVNVLLRDGQAIQRSGVSQAYLPGRMMQLVTLVTGVNVGAYQSDWDPKKPCVLQFFAAMAPEDAKGMSISQQNQAGRLRLLRMDFADFEQEVNTVLSGVWGAAGLDPARDIQAITVNRWPHGYARDRVDLEDPAWLATPGPHEVGRQPRGNIAIANSDSGADAYTHTAIDQAWRAVKDLPDSPV